MEQQRPLSVVELTARSRPTGYNAKKSFRTSLRIALDEFKAGQTAKNGGDVEGAFIHLTRAHTLLTEQLPTHPRYSELEPHGQEAVILRGHEVGIWLDETKALVGRRILDWRLRHMDVPTTPRSRVQSESAISQARDTLKVSDSSARPPPSPSRSAPLLSVSSSKHPSGGRHRRTASDVGKSTSRRATKEDSIRNRSQSPTGRMPSDHAESSKSTPNGALELSGLDVEHNYPTPRIVIRQPTTISQIPNDKTPLNSTDTLDALVSSISAEDSPAVPSLILTDLSSEPSPSQLTLDESASLITPGNGPRSRLCMAMMARTNQQIRSRPTKRGRGP
ncbi:hypothetical protein B0J17DRAFT_724058 [Rhizoctonia solani]|nr:hypothetical protein B0J17DRAFT_724058 [Rhizoctonia solani]